MKGLDMLLKALGIQINPAEVQQLFENLKQELPAFASALKTKVESIEARLELQERMLRAIYAELRERNPVNRPNPIDNLPLLGSSAGGKPNGR